jgi:predicted small secreted protein
MNKQKSPDLNFSDYKDFPELHYYGNLILLPEYNMSDTMLAMIVNRYAWGMNVGVAYLDTETNRLYCSNSENYDYPTGIAIRKSPDGSDYEIYLDCDEVVEVVLYKHPSKYVYDDILNEAYKTKQFEDLKTYKSTYLVYNDSTRVLLKIDDVIFKSDKIERGYTELSKLTHFCKFANITICPELITPESKIVEYKYSTFKPDKSPVLTHSVSIKV